MFDMDGNAATEQQLLDWARTLFDDEEVVKGLKDQFRVSEAHPKGLCDGADKVCATRTIWRGRLEHPRRTRLPAFRFFD